MGNKVEKRVHPGLYLMDSIKYNSRKHRIWHSIGMKIDCFKKMIIKKSQFYGKPNSKCLHKPVVKSL